VKKQEWHAFKLDDGQIRIWIPGGKELIVK
jgi:hypothetical protein